MKLSYVMTVLYASLCASEVLYSMPIDLQNGVVKPLDLMRGESFERAALNFMEANNLISDGVESQRSKNLIAQLAGMLRERVNQKPKEIVLTVPISVEGAEIPLTLLQDESVHDAVARFLLDKPWSEDAKLNAHPTLISILKKKVNEVNSRKQPQFSFDVNIGSQTFQVQHFEGADPLSEANEFAASLGIQDENTFQQVQTGVVSEIRRRLSALEESTTPKSALFTFDITIGNQAFQVQHFEGADPMQEARVFATSLGIQDENVVLQVLNSVAGEIQRRLDEMKRLKTEDKPLFTFDITIGNQAFQVQHFQGADPLQEATAFASSLGIQDQNIFQQVQASVSNEIQRRLNDLKEQAIQKQPLFSFDINIGSQTFQVQHFEGADPVQEARAFATSLGIQDENTFQQVQTGVVNEIRRRLSALEESATPKAPLFTFDVTIGNQAFQVQHFEGADPLQEARAFAASLGIQDENVVRQVVNSVTGEIQRRLEESEPSVAKASKKEIVSIPLTVGQNNALLVHYEGSTVTETVLAFLSENGVTDPATVNQYLPQLVQLLENKLSELNAEKEPKNGNENVPEAPASQSDPLLSYPLTIGNRALTFNYFEGDSPEMSARIFLESHGLSNDPNHAAFVAELTNLVLRGIKEIREKEAESAQLEPLFRLPINLGGETHELNYYERDEPAAVATKFCTSKLDILSVQLGRSATDEDLQDCKVTIFQTITNVIDELNAKKTEKEAETTSKEKELLFTVDIDMGDEKHIGLPFHEGENPQDVATEFCTRNGVDAEYIPILVSAIQEEMAKL